MYKKIKALTWLRTQILLTNSSLLMSVLLPFGLLFLYNMILNKNGNAGQGLLKMILPMTFAMSGGYMVSIMMAEDKEKRNLKTLMLSGVRSTEYLLSMLVYPFLFTVFALLFFPYYLHVDLSGKWPIYLLINLFIIVIILLINLFIGGISKTQSQAQVYSLFPLLLISFVPLFASFDKTIQHILRFTFMNPFINFFETGDYSFKIEDFSNLVIWLLIFISASAYVLSKGRK